MLPRSALVVVLLLSWAFIGSSMPCTATSCSGHGSCDAFGLCVCVPPFTTSSCAEESRTLPVLEPVIKAYSLFLFGDYNAPAGSRVSAFAAVGGNANLQYFSIGDERVPEINATVPAERNDFVIDGVLSFVSGDVMSGGNMVFGSSAYDLTRVSVHGSATKRVGHVIDFPARYPYALLLCEEFYRLSPNGKVTKSFNGVTLTSTSARAVFSISAALLVDVRSMRLNVPTGATVLLNFNGTSSPSDAVPRLALTGDLIGNFAPSKVMWNFGKFSTLEFTAMNIIGTVLAPNADITFPTGTITGAVIAKSMSGHADVNAMEFDGVMDVPTPTATPSVTPSPTPSVTPTISLTPTRSTSPTSTVTSSVTRTSSETPTPSPSPTFYPSGYTPSNSPTVSGPPSPSPSSSPPPSPTSLYCTAADLPPSGDSGVQVSAPLLAVGSVAVAKCRSMEQRLVGESLQALPSQWVCTRAPAANGSTASGLVNTWLPTSWNVSSLQPRPAFATLACAPSTSVHCARLDAVLGASSAYSSNNEDGDSNAQGSVTLTVAAPGSTLAVHCASGSVPSAPGSPFALGTVDAVVRTCLADGTWSAPVPSLPGSAMLPAGATAPGVECVSTASTLKAVLSYMTPCLLKQPTEPASRSAGVAVSLLVAVAMVAAVTFNYSRTYTGAASGIRHALAHATTALRRPIPPAALPLKTGPPFALLPAVLWLALDALFRCAAFSGVLIPWRNSTLQPLQPFLQGFGLLAHNDIVLCVAITFLAAAVVLVVMLSWPQLSAQAPAPNPVTGSPKHRSPTKRLSPRSTNLSQVVPYPLTPQAAAAATAVAASASAATGASPAACSAPTPGKWAYFKLAARQAVAGVLALPLAYLLLQPWACVYVRGSVPFVTSGCSASVPCWTGVHIFTLLCSLVALTGGALLLLRGNYSLGTMTSWSLPHFLPATLTFRLLLAWSSLVLVHFNPSASCALGILACLLLSAAALLFSDAHSAALPVWLLAAGAVCELLPLLYGMGALSLVYDGRSGSGVAVATLAVGGFVLCVAVTCLLLLRRDLLSEALKTRSCRAEASARKDKNNSSRAEAEKQVSPRTRARTVPQAQTQEVHVPMQTQAQTHTQTQAHPGLHPQNDAHCGLDSESPQPIRFVKVSSTSKPILVSPVAVKATPTATSTTQHNGIVCATDLTQCTVEAQPASVLVLPAEDTGSIQTPVSMRQSRRSTNRTHKVTQAASETIPCSSPVAAEARGAVMSDVAPATATGSGGAQAVRHTRILSPGRTLSAVSGTTVASSSPPRSDGSTAVVVVDSGSTGSTTSTLDDQVAYLFGTDTTTTPMMGSV